jgi:hypothetical protein
MRLKFFALWKNKVYFIAVMIPVEEHCQRLAAVGEKANDLTETNVSKRAPSRLLCRTLSGLSRPQRKEASPLSRKESLRVFTRRLPRLR